MTVCFTSASPSAALCFRVLQEWVCVQGLGTISRVTLIVRNYTCITVTGIWGLCIPWGPSHCRPPSAVMPFKTETIWREASFLTEKVKSCVPPRHRRPPPPSLQTSQTRVPATRGCCHWAASQMIFLWGNDGKRVRLLGDRSVPAPFLSVFPFAIMHTA